MMSAELIEHRIGSLRWLVASGERREVFLALAEQAREEIRDVVREMPEVAGLRSRMRDSAQVARQFRGVVQASSRRHPAAQTELRSLSEGAGVDLEDLQLLTLRADLGKENDPDPAGNLGCSDVAVADGTSLIWAHNEDGNPVLAGRSVLLTLQVEDDPGVTSWWYPGFLPGNTFTVSECGLAWGIDHLPVVDPPPLPGRGFVARDLQRCRSLDAMTSYLSSHPAAGGFAYTVCDLDKARVVAVESAAGAMALTRADPVRTPLFWHTNHFRYLTLAEAAAGTGNSRKRGVLLDSIDHQDVDRELLLRMLARDPLPDGVRAAGPRGSVTLSTLVVDQGKGLASLAFSAGDLAVLPVQDLIAGDASRAVTSHYPPGRAGRPAERGSTARSS
jgi:hypothetical protein